MFEWLNVNIPMPKQSDRLLIFIHTDSNEINLRALSHSINVYMFR